MLRVDGVSPTRLDLVGGPFWRHRSRMRVVRLHSRAQRTVLIEGRASHVFPKTSISRKPPNLSWEKRKILDVAAIGGVVIGGLVSRTPNSSSGWRCSNLSRSSDIASGKASTKRECLRCNSIGSVATTTFLERERSFSAHRLKNTPIPVPSITI